MLSCKHSLKATLEYSKLNYDSTKITILNWDTLNPQFPNNSDPLPLTQSDVQLIDSLVRNAVDSFNAQQKSKMSELINNYKVVHNPKLFLIDLGHYKIEYIPYNNVNWQDIVDINCVCDGSEESKKFEVVWGKRRNYCHFRLSIDLRQRKSSEISIDYNFG